MLILQQFFKFLQLLNSETSPRQLCFGFVLGMWMGFTPMLTLNWVIYVLLLLLLRINIAAAFLSYAAFGILSFALDPVFDRVGFAILEMDFLEDFFATLFHAPVVPYTWFYNTVVMGSLVVSLVLSLPLYFLSYRLVIKYRRTVVDKFKQSKRWRAMTATKFYGLYVKYTAFRS